MRLKVCMGISDEVEMPIQMLTEIEGETKNEWIDQKATIVKAEAGRYLIHTEADLADDGKVVWFEVAHVRRAPQVSFGYSTLRHGGLPRDDAITAHQDRWALTLIEACSMPASTTCPDDERPQAEEPGDDYTGEVPRDVCLSEAIDGHCRDKRCWRKHDCESIKQYKAALGTKHWESEKQWWKQWKKQQIRGGRRPNTPTADDVDCAEVNMNKAEVDMDKAEIGTGLRHKGAKKSVHMLYGSSARGQGEAHMTPTARARHANMTQALSHFGRACGAIGRAAVKLAENVDARIKFELNRRRGGSNKDMLSEQSIEQPMDMPTDMPSEQPIEQHTDMPIEQPMDVPTDMPSEQLIEQPMDMPIEQPMDVPTDMPSEQPIEQRTDMPTEQPADVPADMPSKQPIEQPTDMPFGAWIRAGKKYARIRSAIWG